MGPRIGNAEILWHIDTIYIPIHLLKPINQFNLKSLQTLKHNAPILITSKRVDPS